MFCSLALHRVRGMVRMGSIPIGTGPIVIPLDTEEHAKSKGNSLYTMSSPRGRLSGLRLPIHPYQIFAQLASQLDITL
jgi:hypothetical protein